MKILLDTNIFLEILLQQEKAIESKELLSLNNSINFSVTDYTIHSIGTLLFQRKEYNAFEYFLQDILSRIGVGVLSIQSDKLSIVKDYALSFSLDFDDAYQYSVAEMHDLTIVSFDKDFDGTERGRKTPEKIIKLMTEGLQ